MIALTETVTTIFRTNVENKSVTALGRNIIMINHSTDNIDK